MTLNTHLAESNFLNLNISGVFIITNQKELFHNLAAIRVPTHGA
jgi:hypothetical protein